MPSPHIAHRVVRTKNKHSRAVLKDETVIIRLARNLSRTEEQDHIRDLLRRMTRIVLEERTKILINPFQSLLNGSSRSTIELATGKKIVFALEAGDRSKAKRTKEGWHITIGPRCRRKALHRFLWKLVSISEQQRIERMVDTLNAEVLGVRIRGVKMGFASTQWGSCSPSGIIMLNAAMLFVRPEVFRYVTVHELAHRKRADHSPQYWAWVQWAMPGYAKAREKLYDYRLPNL